MGTQTSQADATPTPANGAKPGAALKPKKAVAPRFVSPLVGKDVEEGERVVLEAIADGVPECKITWLHKSKPVRPGPDVWISFEKKKTTLTMPKVRQMHAAHA